MIHNDSCPKKNPINAGHVTPPKVTSRRLRSLHTSGSPIVTHLRGDQPTPTIKDSSDVSILEPGG